MAKGEVGGAASHPRMFRALRHRPFAFYFWAQLASNTGIWAQQVALGWLVFSLTGSAAMLGLVAFAGQGLFIVLAPLAGAAADRLSRRGLLIGTQILAFLVTAALAWLAFTGQATMVVVLVTALLGGVAMAFDIPVRQTLLREIVPAEDMPNAIALNSSMLTASRLLGPAVAGGFLAVDAEAWCFLFNALTFLPVIASLLNIREEARNPLASQGFGRQLAEGWAFASTALPIRALAGLAAIVASCGMPYQALLPAFAALHAQDGAVLLAALHICGGLGALAGSLALAARTGLKGISRWIGIGAAAFGLALILMGVAPGPITAGLLAAIAGAGQMVQMSGAYTLIQMIVPDRVRGRVLSLYSALQIGLVPFGALALGWLSTTLGIRWSFGLGGVACLVASLLFLTVVPRLRAAARAMIEERS